MNDGKDVRNEYTNDATSHTTNQENTQLPLILSPPIFLVPHPMRGSVANTTSDSGVLESVNGFFVYPMKFHNTFGTRTIYCKEDT